MANMLRGPLIINAAGGDDKVIGSAGNDIITGGAGTDDIDGGAGVDTAIYATALSATDVTFAAGKWDRARPGTEGNRNTFERPKSSTAAALAAPRSSWSGGGGFATIQSAINASHSGDTHPRRRRHL